MSDKYSLYLDTSNPEAVMAIYKGGNISKKVVWQGHRELSATLSKKLLEISKKEKINVEDIEGIYVFIGPGSFTGLRIGISFANALSYGLGIPIYAVRRKEKINFLRPRKIVIPKYGAPAKITKAKKANNHKP